MPDYRRFYIPNAAIFITCVTHHRLPFLANEQDVELLLSTIHTVQQKYPFTILAYVILPDHFHWLIQRPEDSPNFSNVMLSLKWNFTLNYKQLHQIQSKTICWQRGFWDHIIRNDKDFSLHMDYIHWNPVKHQLVKDPGDWKYSSLMHWVKEGFYPQQTNDRFNQEELNLINFE